MESLIGFLGGSMFFMPSACEKQDSSAAIVVSLLIPLRMTGDLLRKSGISGALPCNVLHHAGFIIYSSTKMSGMTLVLFLNSKEIILMA